MYDLPSGNLDATKTFEVGRRRLEKSDRAFFIPCPTFIVIATVYVITVVHRHQIHNITTATKALHELLDESSAHSYTIGSLLYVLIAKPHVMVAAAYAIRRMTEDSTSCSMAD